MGKDRIYRADIDGLIFDIDFGKENSNDSSYEIISKEMNDKVEVLSIKDLGKAKDWDKDNIRFYLFTVEKRPFDDKFRWSLIK